MKFIPIMEISAQIMTLIDEAEKQLIIVSPYVEISKWEKVKRCLKIAKKRNIEIVFYVRENATNNLAPLIALGIRIVQIKDLHAKIYLNEQYGIVSSQNLIQYSDTHSIDFAYRTETDQEKKQLQDLVNKYLASEEPSEIKQAEIPVKVAGHVQTEIKCTDFDFTALKEAFDQKFAPVNSNQTSTYVYCEQLLPNADVMLREGFEIRFSYGINERDPLYKAINQIVFKNNHFQYERSYKGGANGKRYSIMFRPLKVNDMQKLIFDYVFMAQAFKDATKDIKIKNPMF